MGYAAYRDPARIDRMIGALREAWHKHPDLRLGQLVSNAPYFDASGTNLGHAQPAVLVEDDAMECGLRGLIARVEAA